MKAVYDSFHIRDNKLRTSKVKVLQHLSMHENDLPCDYVFLGLQNVVHQIDNVQCFISE